MKELSFEKMEELHGGSCWGLAAAGLGMVVASATGQVWGTVIAGLAFMDALPTCTK